MEFVLDYTKYPMNHYLYMNFPKGIKIIQGNGKTQVLKLMKNIYGQKQTGQVCNIYMEFPKKIE